MANVKKGQLVRAPEWWKHLRWVKRVFWKAASPSREEMVQWRNGNAAVCKTAMSRLDTDLHLHCLDSSMDRASVF